MSGEQGTLQRLAAHLAGAVGTLDRAFRDPAAFRALMQWLGWDVTGPPPASYAAVADAAAAALAALEDLADEPELGDVLDVIAAAGAVYQAAGRLHEAPEGIDPGEFLPGLPGRLLEYLLAQRLLDAAPGWFSALEALGVITLEDNPPAGGRRGYTRLRFDWDRLPATLADPAVVPAGLYGWGTGELDFPALAEVLGELVSGLGLPSSIDRLSDEEGAALQADATGSPAAPVQRALSVVLFDRLVAGSVQDIGLTIAELPAEGHADPGVIVQLLVPDGIGRVSLGDGWTFAVDPGTDLREQLAVVIRPAGVSVRYPGAPGRALPASGFGMSMSYDAGQPLVLFGQPGGTRLEVVTATLGLSVAEIAGELELKGSVTVEGLALVLGAGDLDGFLAGTFGVPEARIELTFGLSWSSRTGLDFTGGSGFEISLHPHLDAGVLSFDQVDLALALVTGARPELDVQASASFSGVLGPISYVVDRFGAELPVTFADGNAGPFGVDLRPLWPTGLGLAIDAGLVTGGGFISFDPEAGRYTGVVSLDLFGVGVAVIGILDTLDAAGRPLPPPGFSFLLIVSVELPPIQLGFGFTLNGVGGLAAVNRRLDSLALLDGVRAGALDAIMFPEDPVRDAPRIVADSGEIFPVVTGRYVFGPIAIIGWGTPTLIELELGVVLEVPDPITLALLGVATVALPDPDAPALLLNLDVAAVLDLGLGLLAVDASLRDSYVAGFALAGDLSMRLSFGAAANFALAVGGLNPHFDPPPGFPTLRRVSVALGLGDNPRITLDGYFAVTPNSLQAGARAELYVEAEGFSVTGWVGFDVLFVFQPFSFRFDFSAGMTLKRGDTRIAGITIDGHLQGPAPFHAWGSGSVTVLIIDVRVPFDATFGEREPAGELAPADPWPPLQAAIELGESWTAELPAETTPGVTLAAAADGPDLLLHPMGTATLRQHVIPLNRILERFGQYEITGPKRFDVTGVRVGDAPAGSWSVATDLFAPADFEDLPESEKLSRDSFEPMDAGVSVGTEALDTPEAGLKAATLDYETKIIDAPWRSHRAAVYRPGRVVQLVCARTGAKAAAPLATSGTTKFARVDARPPAVTLAPERYAAASTDTLQARPGLAVGVTKGEAVLAVKHAPAASSQGVQVVPVHELESRS
jgi:hypothetical protein